MMQGLRTLFGGAQNLLLVVGVGNLVAELFRGCTVCCSGVCLERVLGNFCTLVVSAGFVLSAAACTAGVSFAVESWLATCGWLVVAVESPDSVHSSHPSLFAGGGSGDPWANPRTANRLLRVKILRIVVIIVCRLP